MKNKFLTIIKEYGVMPQLKYFQSEVFELNEAIIKREVLKDYFFENDEWLKEHIAEEIADVMVMLFQFMEFYEIPHKKIKEIMTFKVDRQLGRIADEKSKN